jgi:hypothetical protein
MLQNHSEVRRSDTPGMNQVKVLHVSCKARLPRDWDTIRVQDMIIHRQMGVLFAASR